MHYVIVFLINGFLLSITPSAVTDTKCANNSPVIKENCSEEAPAPFVQPKPSMQPSQPQNGTGVIDQDTIEKFIRAPACPDGKAC